MVRVVLRFDGQREGLPRENVAGPQRLASVGLVADNVEPTVGAVDPTRNLVFAPSGLVEGWVDELGSVGLAKCHGRDAAG